MHRRAHRKRRNTTEKEAEKEASWNKWMRSTDRTGRGSVDETNTRREEAQIKSEE